MWTAVLFGITGYSSQLGPNQTSYITPAMGNEFLQNIYITPGAGKLLNDEEVCPQGRISLLAQLAENSEYMQLFLCPPILLFGSVTEQRQEGIAAPLTCNMLDEHVSWKMRTFAAVLLSIYLRINKLVMPPLIVPMNDLQLYHGPWSARRFSQDVVHQFATWRNTESYIWFILELFWTTRCKKSFNDPLPDDDPRFGTSLHLFYLPRNMRPIRDLADPNGGYADPADEVWLFDDFI